ncbi:MAG TPA: hypothetical protein VK658_28415, partial [Chryseolinea sp.]|nr:hypothetical protein [Chryseolinea sp.]
MATTKRTMHSPIAIVEAALKKSWAFRYNEVLSNIEYQELAAPGFNMMNDYTLNSMARSLSHHGIVTNASSIRDLIMSDFAPRHNPFADYL